MKFKKHKTIGVEEIKAVNKVLKSGVLSAFYASYPEGFEGGKYVRLFEKKLKKFYNVKYAIVLNSWTSGLIAAVGALDINPGDEIIVSPWTMSATATAILHWGAIPVFADIEPKTFSIDPKKIKKLINKKTKAIITVDIFGHPSNIKEIKKIIKNKDIKIICDSAQSPYAISNNKIAGTLSDIGGYSLNCHKHINTGEGGIIVTNNAKLANRIKLIRNHAEAVVDKQKYKQINNMVGYNFRMGEIEAAIGIEQYKKLKKIIKIKQSNANYLSKKLSKLKGLQVPIVEKNCTHNYYTFPMVLNLKEINFTREELLKELRVNGLEGFVGGYTNLHMLPIYQKKIAHGKLGHPWSTFQSKVSYQKGICPIAEYLHDKAFLNFEICSFDLTDKELNFICKKFSKIWKKLIN